MPKVKKIVKRKPSRLIPVLIPIAVLIVLLASSGFAFAAVQESRDIFCASCHTQPESTYYQRSLDIQSQNAQPVDLASMHQTKATRCIDCHSGAGLFGRLSAEMLGARNAALFYSGRAVQPAKLTVPIGDNNCLKCHQVVTGQTTRDNHFHGFLSRWQAADANAAGCVSCHGGHTTDGTPDTGFMNTQTVTAVCEACHAVLQGE
jgi:hypothetical protein